MAPPHDLQTFFTFIFILLKTNTYGVFAKILRCGTMIALIYNQQKLHRFPAPEAGEGEIMEKLMKAVGAAYAAAVPEHRLWVLAQGADNLGIATIDLGGFIQTMGGTDEELGRLLLHRAAKQGLRPESEIIR